MLVKIVLFLILFFIVVDIVVPTVANGFNAIRGLVWWMYP